MQKTLPQCYKTQIKNLPFPGLALSGSEQPGPEDTLSGWPKSIYHSECPWMTVNFSRTDYSDDCSFA